MATSTRKINVLLPCMTLLFGYGFGSRLEDIFRRHPDNTTTQQSTLPTPIPRTASTSETQTQSLADGLSKVWEDTNSQSNDIYRRNHLKEPFHDHFTEMVQDAITKRGPLSIEDYKKRYATDPEYRKIFQDGVSVFLHMQGVALVDYHAEGTNAEAKKTFLYPMYPRGYDFRKTKTGAELVKLALGQF